MPNNKYINSVLRWRKNFEADLRRKNNWLALAGLFWLHEGTNTIGSDPASDILLPERAPLHFGQLEFDGSRVTFHANGSQSVEINGVKKMNARLRSDLEKDPSFIDLDGLRLVVVQRRSGTGLRLWDNTLPQRKTYPVFTWYPVSEEYRIAASYIRYRTPRVIQMPDIFGSLGDEKLDGEVKFRFAGIDFRLPVNQEKNGSLFVQFKDLTAGKTTYPAGRYHYTEPPRYDQVFVDFNRAYNPPCVLTPYATCTFAPEENYLKASVEAGEMYSLHPSK